MFDLDVDCAIILNGTISKKDIALLKYYDKIKHSDAIKIAADGAANILIKNKIIPNFIVGDLDSFNLKKHLTFSKQLVKIPNQDQYDFEKCLEIAISNDLKSILIFGINGGLFDHTLNNWSIFIKYSSKLSLLCYVEGQIGKLINDDISFVTNIDDIISIIPFPNATLTTEGLKWNLNDTILEFGKSEGARNKAINNNISIKLHSGKYMLFIGCK